MAKATAKFVPPVIHDNESGWGPTGIPEQFKDMPYQPYAKSDRLGKVSCELRILPSIKHLLSSYWQLALSLELLF
jgi:hypothetical protein